MKFILLKIFIVFFCIQSNTYLYSQEKQEYKIKSDGEFEYTINFFGEDIKGVYTGEYYKAKIDGEKTKIPHGNGVLTLIANFSESNVSGNSWFEGKLNEVIIVETSKWKFEGHVEFGNPISGKVTYKYNLNALDQSKIGAYKKTYEGTFSNHLYLKGEIIYFSNDQYSGDFVNGIYEGKGTLIFSDGKRYNGEFKNGKFNGNGQLTQNETRLEAIFENGEIIGKSEVFFKNGNHYTGDLVEFFIPEGNGQMDYFTGDFENGSWKNGKFITGTAHYKFEGTTWDGKFLNNKPLNNGVIKYHDNKEYIGDWDYFGIENINLKINKEKIVETKNGFLVLSDKSKYQGFFYLLSGVPHGQGHLILADGKEITGTFFEGKLERKIQCNESEILEKDNPDPILIKSCTWGEFKTKSKGEADEKGRYYFSYELFKLVNNSEEIITIDELINKNKTKLLNMLQYKVNESFNTFSKDPETSDCFIDTEPPVVSWDYFNIEFTDEGLNFIYQFGLTNSCLSVDGGFINIKYEELKDYIE